MALRFKMTVPNLLIVLGTLLIAIGGIIATKGWHARIVATQRNDIIRAVAAETLMNISVFTDPAFTKRSEEELSKFIWFPRMQTVALGGAIASGLFVGEKDRVFWTRAANLHELLADFNQRLSFTGDRMSQKPSEIALFRKKLRDGQVRKNLGVKLQKFGEMLISDYGVKRDDRFFMQLDD